MRKYKTGTKKDLIRYAVNAATREAAAFLDAIMRTNDVAYDRETRRNDIKKVRNRLNDFKKLKERLK